MLKSFKILVKCPQKFAFNFSKSNTSDNFDLIYGINPVQAAFHANRRALQALYLSDSTHIQLSSRTAKLIQLSKERDLPIIFTNKDKMTRMVKQQPHQNIILKCSSLPIPLWKNQIVEPGVYVYCDKITDPQNFGAILRSCLFFGVKAVFTGKKNHCPLNPTVSKTSSGAAELINTILVDNSSTFMSNWKAQEGVIVATSVQQNKPHTNAHELRGVLKQDKVDKILLVLGSEGKGVSSHLVALSDYRVCIQRTGPAQHPYDLVDSMNVSAALSVLLFQLTRKQ